MYLRYMSKIPIDVDDEALAAAQRELGTTTKRDTVNEALRIIARRQKRVQLLLDQAAGVAGQDENPYADLGLGADITDPEIMKGARR
jgi:Arc/MetJ family transcription regulator